MSAEDELRNQEKADINFAKKILYGLYVKPAEQRAAARGGGQTFHTTGELQDVKPLSLKLDHTPLSTMSPQAIINAAKARGHTISEADAAQLRKNSRGIEVHDIDRALSEVLGWH